MIEDGTDSADVLTISKLDSGLFVMTPVDVQLESIARDAVKMFEGEAKSAGIDLKFQIEESCKISDVQHVSLDPTRVLQILIVRHLHDHKTATNCEESHHKCHQVHTIRTHAQNLRQPRSSSRASDTQYQR